MMQPAARTLTSDASIYESRIDLFTVLPTETQSSKLAGDVVLYKDIRLAD